MIDILRTDPSERGAVLLLLLEKRGKIGDILLEDVLHEPSLRKTQDSKPNVDNLAPPEPSNSKNGRALSPPQDKHSGNSQTLMLGEKGPHSSESSRTFCRTSNRPPITVFESKHVITDSLPMTKCHTDGSREATDEPDGAISLRDYNTSTTPLDNPDLSKEPPFHRDPVAVPPGRSLGNVAISSFAVPRQHTGTPAVAEAIIHRASTRFPPVGEEPQVSKSSSVICTVNQMQFCHRFTQYSRPSMSTFRRQRTTLIPGL